MRLKEYSPFPPYTEVKLPVRAWARTTAGFEVGYRPDNSERITDVTGRGVTLEEACRDANIDLYISARRWRASDLKRRKPSRPSKPPLLRGVPYNGTDGEENRTEDDVMNITLKKVKFHADMSEETNAFTADVYVDGKLAGTAKNDGHGGSTFVRFSDPALRDRAEEEYKDVFDGVGGHVDLLLEEHLKEKDKLRIERFVQKQAAAPGAKRKP